MKDIGIDINDENKTIVLRCNDELFKSVKDLLNDDKAQKKQFDILFIAKILKTLKPFLMADDEDEDD